MVNINFKGKSIVQNYHLSVKYHQLVPVKEKSLTEKVSLNDNLIIHGDNLKALKALLPTYAGKIKCIYIDPPYNTGNEKWAYNDNVNSPMMKDWLGKVVDKDDLTRHDKWLCMMMPRLKLLRELLREDGVIFISINDNEIHHLRTLVDEIFGENNFISCLIWNTEGHTDNQYHIKENHEYLLCYIKNDSHRNDSIGFVIDPNTRKESNLWKGYAENSITKNGSGNPPTEVILPAGFPCVVEELQLDKSTISDNFISEVTEQGFISRDLSERYSVQYPIRRSKMIVENYKLASNCIVYSGWANVNKLKKFIENDFQPIPEKNGSYYFYLSGNGAIYYKKEREHARNILSVLRNLGTTERNRYLLEDIGIDFQYPKPLELISYLLHVGTTGTDDIILDSFAGSGTTAHAVLDLNKIDNGNRKFILVECEDYADIITAERVKRVMKGMPESNNFKEGTGGSFSYFKLGDPIEMESILEGDKLPDFEELARYVFYTATGEEFDSSKIDEKTNFIGESRDYQVYLFYKPDLEYLKSTALTLERAKALKPFSGKKRLVFAPAKFLDLSDREFIERYGLKGIEFCQLPFEIYRIKG